ncbi:MAG: hypothetical protein J6A22_08080 [Bacteroidales bacterium]|nr:hypothetical protein [Bacteroidales bacterium]
MKKTIVYMMVLIMTACTSYKKMGQIRSGALGVGLSVPDERPMEEPDVAVRIDSIRGTLSGEPIIMNAIRDTETGEMVATDVINASKVVARFRNVAERAGYVSISFDVTVPSEMSESQWQLKIRPFMSIQDDTLTLDPVFITGKGYREAQLRGYQRYRQFLASIVNDTTDLVRMRQLEIFIERYFPDTYAMKRDSSIVPEPLAMNLFGVTQIEALKHYTIQWKKRLNDRKISRKDLMFNKYVKDPIVNEGIRLDTVMTSMEGDFIYRYVHTFKSRPKLKKVMISLFGEVYEKGVEICSLPFPSELTFYISSLASLADDSPRYKMHILERRVFDNTKAFIDFRQGSASIDTLLGDNSSELRRVVKCIDDVRSRTEYGLDSLVITASCSPEGSYSLNQKLSAARSESVRKYVGEYVPLEWKDSLRTSELPENWGQLRKLVENDTILNPNTRKRLMEIIDGPESPDQKERKMAGLSCYKYLREKIYPKLRSVSFSFHLHRIGMFKDTVHTTELDTVYMAGLRALKELDYKNAVSRLRQYGDYNSALAYMSADYNHSALDVLMKLDDTDPKVCYLKAMVLSRLEQHEEALKYFKLSITYDPYLEHRANLDPEMTRIRKQMDQSYY